MLSAQLWDIRAQCEQKLRTLTDAQRFLDAFAAEPGGRLGVKRRLIASLDEIIAIDGMALESVRQCRDVADDLPTSSPQ